MSAKDVLEKYQELNLITSLEQSTPVFKVLR